MSADPPRLEAAELEPLTRWRRRIRLAFGISIALLLAWAAILATQPDDPWLVTLAVVFATPLVATGLALQLGPHCPRCRARIAPGSRLDLPADCSSCGVSFR